MSVSMLDTPVSASATSDLPPAKVDIKVANEAAAARSFNGQNAAHVNFQSRENKDGPVFGSPQAPTTAADAHGRHHSPQGAQSLLSQFKQWVGHCFSGHRPPTHPGCEHRPPRPNPGCSNPPPRPNPIESNPPPRPDPTAGRPYPPAPGRPDPQYALKNREELAQQLLDNFNAFRDPKKPGYVSVDSILAMAKRGWSPNPVMNENIRLANELLRRPELMAAMDRHSSTGALDGLIDRQKLNMVIKGENYFKYKTDKELAGELLDHFDELKKRSGGSSLQISELKEWARKPLTGDAAKDHLIQLSQEILTRSDVLEKMDNHLSKDGDGKISRRGLYSLSR